MRTTSIFKNSFWKVVLGVSLLATLSAGFALGTPVKQSHAPVQVADGQETHGRIKPVQVADGQETHGKGTGHKA